MQKRGYGFIRALGNPTPFCCSFARYADACSFFSDTRSRIVPSTIINGAINRAAGYFSFQLLASKTIPASSWSFNVNLAAGLVSLDQYSPFILVLPPLDIRLLLPLSLIKIVYR
jgi:hypothetical protein